MHTSNIPHQNRYDFLAGKIEMHSSLFETRLEVNFFFSIEKIKRKTKTQKHLKENPKKELRKQIETMIRLYN